jgi:hypothetical protein
MMMTVRAEEEATQVDAINYSRNASKKCYFILSGIFQLHFLSIPIKEHWLTSRLSDV